MDEFKQKLQSLLLNNIGEIFKIDCLKASYIGPARNKPFADETNGVNNREELDSDGNPAKNEGFKVKVIDKIGNVDSFVEKAKEDNASLIEDIFHILNCFMEKIKDFDFVFKYKTEKLKQQ